MTDDEILDRWHQAELVHAQAGDHDLLEAFIAEVAAEDVAIARFGIGGHLEAYRARFPADVKAKP